MCSKSGKELGRLYKTEFEISMKVLSLTQFETVANASSHKVGKLGKCSPTKGQGRRVVPVSRAGFRRGMGTGAT